MDVNDLPIWVDYTVEFLRNVIGPQSRLWPGYILLFILIGYSIYRYEGKKSGFWKFMFPKEMYFSSSVGTDVKLFLVNALLHALGAFTFIVSRAVIAITVLAWLGGNTDAPSTLHPVLLAAILFVVADFLVYWLHRVHHNLEPLWVFHAVHHSAEVLVPFSAYRQHPLYLLLHHTLNICVLGVVDGVLLALLVSSIEIETLLGVNLLVFIYTITGNNLRHSHIWLSYGPILSYILISPAMHQIHHSRDPKHWNKNYGGALAIFDWMAGTLYIPKEREDLEFGLCDNKGEPIQPHNGFRESMIVPFKHLIRWWSNRKSKRPTDIQPARYNS